MAKDKENPEVRLNTFGTTRKNAAEVDLDRDPTVMAGRVDDGAEKLEEYTADTQVSAAAALADEQAAEGEKKPAAKAAKRK
jgi:hypothetical protein